jgi:hypothetical protein
MSDSGQCITHIGFYDADDNPIDEFGALVFDGARRCGHRDCVNQSHVEGFVEISFHELVVASAFAGGSLATHPTCNFPGCDKRFRSSGLCRNHYAVYRKLKIVETPPKVERYTLDQFKNAKPKVVGSKITCAFDGCSKGGFSRSLCTKHYQIMVRLERKNK